MRALLLVEPGDPPKLEVRDVPLPAVGDREALVKVSACGLCYHDVLVMSGALRRGVKPQLILGHEISGEVVECGALVGTVRPGDRVVSILTNACGACANCTRGREHRCLLGVGIGHGADGGFAEYVKISEASLVRLPPGVDDAGACLFACPMGVALHALRDASELRAGETAVVTGAGGGLGVHAVQTARALGARVLAVTSSQEKEAALRELQPDELIVAPDLDFGEIVQALTGDAGADVVMNNLGAVAFEACWTSMGQFGRMALVGAVTGGAVSFQPAELLFRDARLIGVSGVSRAQISDVANMAAGGLVRPVVSRTFPLEEALDAYWLMRTRGSFGRLVLTPWAPR